MLDFDICSHLRAELAHLVRGSFIGPDGKLMFIMVDTGTRKHDTRACPWCGRVPTLTSKGGCQC